MIRTDQKDGAMAPVATREFLLRFGGKTPFGEANYRLIHTGNRYMKVGGTWNDWPAGTSLEDRGGLHMSPGGVLLATGNKPIRTVVEVRDILMYGHIEDRWILERWQPAHMYGSRVQWENMVVPFHPDVPLLGPYPEFGDYVMASEPTPHVPGHSQLQETIQHCEFLHLQHAATVEQGVLERYNEALERDEKERKEAREALEMQLMDAMIPTGRISLAAGRHREMLAKRLGMKGHFGN